MPPSRQFTCLLLFICLLLGFFCPTAATSASLPSDHLHNHNQPPPPTSTRSMPPAVLDPPITDNPPKLAKGEETSTATATTTATDAAAPYVWMAQEKDGSWKPLWHKDTAALEAALKEQSESKSPNLRPTVTVENGRFEVDLVSREIYPLYWNAPARPVRRTSWWVKTITSWLPYDEKDAELVESLYQSVMSGAISPSDDASIREVHLTDGIHKVVAMPKLMDQPFGIGASTNTNGNAGGGGGGGGGLDNNFHGFFPLPGANNKGAGGGSGSGIGNTSGGSGEVRWELIQQRIKYGIGIIHDRSTRRGIPPREYTQTWDEEAEGDREVNHLVFVVHGIGEKIWSTEVSGFPSLRAATGFMRTKVLEEQMRAESMDENSPTKNYRTELLPVEWFDSVREDDSELVAKLQAVTLPGAFILRQFANDAILDAVVYLVPTYRQKILDTVCRRINEKYRKYKERHPDFKGKVSLVGHSLGSVILFDLCVHQKGGQETDLLTPADKAMTYPQLDMPVHVFMMLGSPLGVFLSVREDDPSASYEFPTVDHFYNVFHPYDPVAYRVEPLLQRAMASVPPVFVPHHMGGGLRTFTKLRQDQKALATSVTDTAMKITDTALSIGGQALSIGGQVTSWFSRTTSARKAENDTIEAVKRDLGGNKTTPLLTTSSSIDESTIVMTTTKLLASSSSTPPTATGGGSSSSSGGGGDTGEPRIDLIGLNRGKRFDYVLQEAPTELSEYLSAIAAHNSYWDNLDVNYFLYRALYEMEIEG